jgi:hypothetical protein
MLHTEDEDQRATDSITAAIKHYARSSVAARIFSFGTDLTMTQLDRIWRQRPFLIACSVPVRISHQPEDLGVTVMWREFPVLSVPPEDLVPPKPPSRGREESKKTTAEPRLDIVLGTFGTATLCRAAVVSHADQVLSCTAWGPPSNQDTVRQQVLESFASREERLSGARQIQVIPELIVKDDFVANLYQDHIRAGLDKIVDSAYQDTAFWHAPNAVASDHCAELMRDTGMYALLGSADMLKRTALLGLAAGLNSYKNQIDQVFRENGYDLQDTVYQLNQCRDRHGFPVPLQN